MNPYAIATAGNAPLSEGQMLDYLLRSGGLTQTEAALRAGVTRQYLNTVIKGKAPFTTELQWKLKGLLGKDIDFWENVARRHEEYMKSPEGLRRALAEREDEISVQWDIHGPHTLLNFEVETAVQSDVISISTLKGDRSVSAFDPERLQLTRYQLSLGEVVTVTNHEGKKSFGKDASVLQPRETALLSTLESIKTGGRVRIHITGTCGKAAAHKIAPISDRIVEPWSNGPLSFEVYHFGSKPLELVPGEPWLAVSFEYLAMEPKLPVEPAEADDEPTVLS